MKTRIVILAVLAALLLVGTVVLAQPIAPAGGEPGTISGGGYRLTTLTWQVHGAVSGGGYSLVVPAAQVLQLAGSGCCCTYLPCTWRDFRP